MKIPTLRTLLLVAGLSTAAVASAGADDFTDPPPAATDYSVTFPQPLRITGHLRGNITSIAESRYTTRAQIKSHGRILVEKSVRGESSGQPSPLVVSLSKGERSKIRRSLARTGNCAARLIVRVKGRLEGRSRDSQRTREFLLRRC